MFPKPAEIDFDCSCPDFASMCKHIAAVLYGVGSRLDKEPELLFRLRAVDEKDLIAGVDKALPLSKKAPAAKKVLRADDVSALFGLDMAGEAPPKKSKARPKSVAPQSSEAPRRQKAASSRKKKRAVRVGKPTAK